MNRVLTRIREDKKEFITSERLEKYPNIDKVFYWEVDSGENVVKYMKRCSKFVIHSFSFARKMP